MRVADPWHANNAMVLMLGGADKLVATTAQAKRPALAASAVSTHRAGPRGLQRIRAMSTGNPDRRASGRHSHGLWRSAAQVVRGRRRAYHIPVVLMPNTSLEGLEDHRPHDREVLGNEELARCARVHPLLRCQHSARQAVTAGLPEPSGRRCCTPRPPAFSRSMDGKTVIDDWINIAGGINAADVAGNGRPVTMEQVAAWNPDVIIVGTAPNPQNRQAILDDPRWREINAVKNGKVFVNPERRVSLGPPQRRGCAAGAVGSQASASRGVCGSRCGQGNEIVLCAILSTTSLRC